MEDEEDVCDYCGDADCFGECYWPGDDYFEDYEDEEEEEIEDVYEVPSQCGICGGSWKSCPCA